MKVKEHTPSWSSLTPPERRLDPPTVYDVRKYSPGSLALYIGRYMPAAKGRQEMEASDWANLFKPASDRADDRADAIRLYTEALLEAPLRSRVGELAGLHLLCWCAPRLCHGDALAELVAATRFYGSTCPHCGGPVDSFLNWHAGLRRFTEAWVCRAPQTVCGRRGEAARPVPRCLIQTAPALL